MRIRRFQKKLRTLAASRPGLEQKALRFFHSTEEIKQILDKAEKLPGKNEKNSEKSVKKI